MEEYYWLCTLHFLWPVSFSFPSFLSSFYFEHHCLCLMHWMAWEHNMVIQSLRFSDLCWCFLLQHFFAKLQDKMDQKHFVEFHTTTQTHRDMSGATEHLKLQLLPKGCLCCLFKYNLYVFWSLAQRKLSHSQVTVNAFVEHLWHFMIIWTEVIII